MEHGFACSWLWALVHIGIAVISAVTAIRVADITARNKRVDQLRDFSACDRCMEHRRRFHHLHDGVTVREEGHDP
jgi:hypothetical protein